MNSKKIANELIIVAKALIADDREMDHLERELEKVGEKISDIRRQMESDEDKEKHYSDEHDASTETARYKVLHEGAEELDSCWMHIRSILNAIHRLKPNNRPFNDL